MPCIGLLPRTFWKNAGRGAQRATDALRLCARQACCGADSIAWEDITRWGKNSPFMKLPEIGGRPLFIGEVLDCCTFMHGVEERFGTDYVLTKEKIRSL